MKPKNLTTGRSLLLLLTVSLTIGLVSWGYQQSPGQYQQSVNDTTPKRNHRQGKEGP